MSPWNWAAQTGTAVSWLVSSCEDSFPAQPCKYEQTSRQKAADWRPRTNSARARRSAHCCKPRVPCGLQGCAVGRRTPGCRVVAGSKRQGRCGVAVAVCERAGPRVASSRQQSTHARASHSPADKTGSLQTLGSPFPHPLGSDVATTAGEKRPGRGGGAEPGGGPNFRKKSAPETAKRNAFWVQKVRPLFGLIFLSPLTTNRVRGPESGATFGTHFLVRTTS